MEHYDALLFDDRPASRRDPSPAARGHTDPMAERSNAVVLGRSVAVVDLSHPLGPTESEPSPLSVRRTSHHDGAALWQWIYGIPAGALPEHGGFAGEEVSASTHASTHVDAPWHYGPEGPDGEPAATIDNLPLDTFMGPLIVVDVRDHQDGDTVSEADLRARLNDLRPPRSGDVVVLRTGAEQYWGAEDFWRRGSGFDATAVEWLVKQGVRLIGTDAWSLDRPYPLIGESWATHPDPQSLWPAHFAGARHPYCQIEKLRNLDQVPTLGATIIAAPIAVVDGSAGWVRAFALI